MYVQIIWNFDCNDELSIYGINVGLVKSKIDELVSIGKPPAVFIAEPLSGNAGGVELPYGYLKGVYEEIRAVGGLCISDEVQVGYSRYPKDIP